MTGGKTIALAGVAMLAMTACGQERGKLEIRSISTPLAAGDQSVPFRIAEGRAYFALNNVGLAIEAFRKALRDDPNSVDALNGIAASYDRMGRFDLSRRHYEMALAIDPADPRLYANLALSLDMQGKATEAASVRGEMTQRMAATAQISTARVVSPITAPEAALAAAPVAVAKAVPSVRSEPVAVAPANAVLPIAGPSVVVALAPAKPVAPLASTRPLDLAKPVAPVAVPAPVEPVKGVGSVTVALAPARPVAPARARLERMSIGQVALITTGQASHAAPARLAAATTRRIAPAPIVLLNAARHQGLAARTRSYLAQKGWSTIEIGDAPQVADRSVILYPATRRQQAVRLAGQFGFALRHGPSSTDRLTILLGRDAAAKRLLRAKSA